VNGTLRDPEGATYPNRRELAAVNQAIHRHLRHTHKRRDLGDGGKLYVGQPGFLSHRAPHIFNVRHRAEIDSGIPPLYLLDSEYGQVQTLG
jgi:hypothetical protein